MELFTLGIDLAKDYIPSGMGKAEGLLAIYQLHINIAFCGIFAIPGGDEPTGRGCGAEALVPHTAVVLHRESKSGIAVRRIARKDS